jgi:NAD(P)-dependent dehydrogenase (short-subunit alcohol dehydrogenase family)
MTILSGKVVAVTGTASGIGRALSLELAARGAHVALADVNEVGLRETAALVRGGGKVTTHLVDVRDPAVMQAFANEVEAQHGGADVIINNAGVAVRASLEDISFEDFDFVMDVNFYGVWYGVKAFLPLFKKRGAGHFVNISSINAMVPFALNGPYNASKYAVLGLSETLMQEFRGTQIRTTCVHPGGIKTNIVRNSRGVSQRDVATFDRIAMNTPETAAKTILDGVERNKERVYVGVDAKIMAAVKRVAPALMVKIAGNATRAKRPRV